MKWIFRTTAILTLCAAAVAAAQAPKAVQVSEARLVDASGATLQIYGVNVGEKSPAKGWRPWQGPEDLARLRDWGHNCIRLLIFWAAVEPEPGVYDDAYLEEVAAFAKLAERQGLFVILDMHQDLWGGGIRGANGAPAWATLTDGLPHVKPRGPWSVAYSTSPAVQRAFDHFWANTPGPGGVGIQDRYASAWQHVARRFAGEAFVIGYDLMNEPFMGSPIRGAIFDVFRHLPVLLRGLSAAGGGEAERGHLPPRLLAAFGDEHRYRDFLAILDPWQQQFERTRLQPMYERVARAIREVDPHTILFLEPAPMVNFGVRSALSPVLRAADGERDPQQALFPHAYDILTDTAAVAGQNPMRMRIILERISEQAQAQRWPCAVGEWGAYYGREEALPAAREVNRLAGEFNLGLFYWEYHKGMDNNALLDAIRRK
ncbi:MAG: cellulase family glycosylhydrolase [Candidatus Hydrogenedentes bacterium]|nr:cellulase family glycosylhydrolase [Candidatus Hydrogenedentota bacterium]